LPQQIVANATGWGYAGNGQFTVFSTVSIFWPYEFSSAIKATLNEAEVDLQRPDYHYLQVLAEMLDGAEARAGGTN
jgi:hypothetical protein